MKVTIESEWTKYTLEFKEGDLELDRVMKTLEAPIQQALLDDCEE